MLRGRKVGAEPVEEVIVNSVDEELRPAAVGSARVRLPRMVSQSLIGFHSKVSQNIPNRVGSFSRRVSRGGFACLFLEKRNG